MATYTVLAILEAKTGQEDLLRKHLTEVISPSRSEESCIDYRLHEDLNQAGKFFFYENWISQEAHQAQFEKPYIKTLGDKIGELLAKPYEVIFGAEISPN